MFNQRFKVTLIILPLCCAQLFLITGCTLLWQNSRKTPEIITPQPVVEEEVFTPNLKPNEYKKEIARLQRIIVSQPKRSEKATAHFQLAGLYASYNNPEKSYQIALQHLKSYISIDPQAKKDYHVQNRLSLLKKITRLSEENTKLQQTIEELKILDQQIEQKRERYR